jgi:hypothetical protein
MLMFLYFWKACPTQCPERHFHIGNVGGQEPTLRAANAVRSELGPRGVRYRGVSFEVRNPFGSATGAIMADKSPRQAASKKAGKSIKEKRADKRAANAPASSLDVTSKAAKKK